MAAEAGVPPAGRRARAGRRPGWARRALPYGVAGLAYLALSVVLWWHVWTSHPSSVATCGCGDPALFLWFLEWPAYAIAHGHSPFFSTALFHPTGINLLSNTSVLAIGIPLAPVTWLFGPVATLNVASTLAPVLSALAAFWVARRWVRWAPAAFVGGLLYGFSPFVLGSLVFAHLMSTSLALLPLMLGCLDELLVRQRRRPVAVGVVLALLVVLEFFVSTEMVVISAVGAVAGVVLLVLYRAVVARDDLLRRARRAAPGLLVALVLVVALLAWPAWYALAGPAHLSGEVWPNIPVIGGLTPASFVDAGYATQHSFLLDLGGYFGPPLPSAGYLGWGLFAVLAAGLVVWFRDRRLWFFGTLALLTGLLSLGIRRHEWVPWQILARLPVLDNVVEQRFMAVAILGLAVMLAVVVDQVHQLRRPAALGTGRTARHARADRTDPTEMETGGMETGGMGPDRRVAGGHTGSGAGAARGRGGAGGHTSSGGGTGRLVLSWGVAAVVAAVALGPIAWVLAPKLPFAVRPVNLPPWYTERAPRLPAGEVLLAYPAPFSGIQSAMAWQAVDRMHFSQAGGGGPQGVAKRAGAEEAGFRVLATLGLGLTAPAAGTPAQLAAVRQAIRGWGVTMVVIPQQPGQPALLRGRSPAYAAAFMTDALGTAPVFRSGAWVWPAVDLGHPARQAAPGVLLACSGPHHPPRTIGPCVLGTVAG